MTTETGKHWTDHYTFHCKVMDAKMTAAEIIKHERYGPFLRRARFNLINCLLHDCVRMDDGTRWERIQ